MRKGDNCRASALKTIKLFSQIRLAKRSKVAESRSRGAESLDGRAGEGRREELFPLGRQEVLARPAQSGLEFGGARLFISITSLEPTVGAGSRRGRTPTGGPSECLCFDCCMAFVCSIRFGQLAGSAPREGPRERERSHERSGSLVMLVAGLRRGAASRKTSARGKPTRDFANQKSERAQARRWQSLPRLEFGFIQGDIFPSCTKRTKVERAKGN